VLTVVGTALQYSQDSQGAGYLQRIPTALMLTPTGREAQAQAWGGTSTALAPLRLWSGSPGTLPWSTAAEHAGSSSRKLWSPLAARQIPAFLSSPKQGGREGRGGKAGQAAGHHHSDASRAHTTCSLEAVRLRELWGLSCTCFTSEVFCKTNGVGKRWALFSKAGGEAPSLPRKTPLLDMKSFQATEL